VSTSIIALLIALAIVSILVIHLAIFSYMAGILSWAFGKPKLSFYKSTHGSEGVLVDVNWNILSEAIPVDYIRFKLFNPFGNPTQIDVSREIPTQKGSFSHDLHFGEELKSLVGAENIDRAKCEIELGSSKEGEVFQFLYSGKKIKNLLEDAPEYTKEKEVANSLNVITPSIPERKFIADDVSGKTSYLKIATNPLFSDKFSPMAGEAEAGNTAEAKENYAIKKVWIEPGCIVCNACEDIFPEVFEVTSDTCLIRDGAPLDDGLRIEEASDACPVEVIKFEIAG